MEYSIATDGGALKFTLLRKNIGNIHIRVTGASEVVVSAPLRTAESRIVKFVSENAPKICQSLEMIDYKRRRFYPVRYSSGDKFWHLGQKTILKVVESNRASAVYSGGMLLLHVRKGSDIEARKALFMRWSKRAASAVFAERLAVILPRFSTNRDITINVKNMLTRWGSINTALNTMSLSIHLLRCDVTLIDYIITHELCHLKFPDHSASFYRELDRHVPDRERIDNMLDEYGLVDFN
jgi:predicted metal-dependent hydrolase